MKARTWETCWRSTSSACYSGSPVSTASVDAENSSPRIQTTGEKIARIRQSASDLSPAWMPPGDAVAASGADPWVKRLIYMTAGVLLITLILFGVYKMSLGSGVGRMETLAAQGRS